MNIDQANNINWQIVRFCVNTSSLDNRGVIGKIWNNVLLTIFRSWYWLFTNNGYLNNKNIELLVKKYGYHTKPKFSIEHIDDSIKKIFHEVSNFITLEKTARWLDLQVSLKADDNLKLNSQQKKIIKKVLRVILKNEKYERTIDLSDYNIKKICPSDKEQNILNKISSIWADLFGYINMFHAIMNDNCSGAIRGSSKPKILFVDCSNLKFN